MSMFLHKQITRFSRHRSVPKQPHSELLESRRLLAADVFVLNSGSNTIGEYTDAGATVNASLITGLSSPQNIAVSGSNLFVLDYSAGTVEQYTNSGTLVNASLVSGLTNPDGIVVDGTDLFISSNDDTIGEYTTAGATVNAALVTGIGNESYSLTASGADLFVASYATGTIGEYSTAGATINASLITGLSGPFSITASGPDLFVANQTADTVGEYTTSGATVNAALISGLSLPAGVAVSGSDLFVSNYTGASVGEYTTSGATVNATLFSGLSDPLAVVVSAGTNNQLAFAQPPVGTAINATLAPITVDVEDAAGNLLTGDHSNVTIAVTASTAAAILNGTTTVAAVGGVATFSNLSFATSGSYTLTATDGTETSATSTLFTITPGAATSGATIYAVDQGNELFTLNTGSGQITDIGNVGVFMNDIAEDPTGQLYGIDGSGELDKINSTTAALTDIGNVNPSFNSLAFSPSGVLYGASDSLYTINVTTGAATLVGSLGNNYLSGGDLAFDGSGNLYLSTTSNDLVKVNPNTGTATDIGPLGFNDVFSLAYGSDGTMYGICSQTNQVFSINLTTGAGTVVSTFNDENEVDGAASLPTASTHQLTPVETIGGLDPNFGNQGLASHSVGFSATDGVARDGAQSVLIGTVGSPQSESFGVTRYNADGSLDTNFGTAGVTTISFGGTDDIPTAVNVLAGGQILIAGTATTSTDGIISGSEFAVAELNADGSMDTTFGNGGQALVSFSSTTNAFSNDLLDAMVVSGGTIYLGGSSDAAGKGNTDFAVAALTASGSLDTAFNSGEVRLDFSGGDDVINSLAAQTNGDLVAAGSATIGGTTQIAIARFLPSGQLDKHFGLKGIVTTNVRGVYDSAASVFIQSKGQIVLGGVSATGAIGALGSDFVVERYTSAGRLDRTFGGSGTVITSFGQPSAVTQVLLQPDGSIIASGKTAANLTSVVPSELDVAVVRYTTRGVLDTSFNGTGKTIVSLTAGVVSTNNTHTVSIAAELGNEFGQFAGSAQGVVTQTTGGALLDAGNSDANTVEAEIITAGIDLLAKVLSALPASVLGGLKGTASVSIEETGTTQAIGSVTLVIQFATDAQGDGAVTADSIAERISLKQGQTKPYKVAFIYPAGLADAGYYLVATVKDPSTLTDLNLNNNTAPSSSAVTIASPKILLVGSELSPTDDFTLGKSVDVAVNLTNDGNVMAKGKITVELFLSSDQTPADGMQISNSPLVVGLSAEKAHAYKIKVLLPIVVPSGSFYLLALIDPAKSLGSIDQTNSVVVDPTLVSVS